MISEDDVLCHACHGTGIVECGECGGDTDCDDCDGSGLDPDLIDVDEYIKAWRPWKRTTSIIESGKVVGRKEINGTGQVLLVDHLTDEGREKFKAEIAKRAAAPLPGQNILEWTE